MQENKNPRRRLILVAMVIVLICTFALTVYASTRVAKEVKENYFQTGTIKINLNDGKGLFDSDESDSWSAEHGYAFEPGVTVVKNFFVRNEGTDDFYYKIYFRDVQGGLSDILEVTIQDAQDAKGEILFSGILADMTRLAVKPADDVLVPGGTRNLTITFHYPEERGNEGQDQHVSFTMCADAVQTRNNLNKEFN